MLSYQAQTQKAFNDVRNQVLGYVFTTCFLPPAASITLPVDGWGSSLNYVPIDIGTKIPSLAGPGAYTLWSSGPDKLTGTAPTNVDDIHRDLDLNSLKGILTPPFLLAAPCI
jgi:hypothetical protein